MILIRMTLVICQKWIYKMHVNECEIFLNEFVINQSACQMSATCSDEFRISVAVWENLSDVAVAEFCSGKFC